MNIKGTKMIANGETKPVSDEPSIINDKGTDKHNDQYKAWLSNDVPGFDEFNPDPMGLPDKKVCKPSSER